MANALMSHFQPTKTMLDQRDINGWTALVYATYRNNFVMVQILIGAGANPLIQTDDGYTAIDYNAFFLNEYRTRPDDWCDASDPRPKDKQIRVKFKNQEIIRKLFEPFDGD